MPQAKKTAQPHISELPENFVPLLGYYGYNTLYLKLGENDLIKLAEGDEAVEEVKEEYGDDWTSKTFKLLCYKLGLGEKNIPEENGEEKDPMLIELPYDFTHALGYYIYSASELKQDKKALLNMAKGGDGNGMRSEKFNSSWKDEHFTLLCKKLGILK